MVQRGDISPESGGSGRNRCYDNIQVERLWRTAKYEEIYLRAYCDEWEAENSLARFLWRYCHVMPQRALEGRTPDEVYDEKELCTYPFGVNVVRPQAGK